MFNRPYKILLDVPQEFFETGKFYWIDGVLVKVVGKPRRGWKEVTQPLVVQKASWWDRWKVRRIEKQILRGLRKY